MGNNFLKAPKTDKQCDNFRVKRFRVGVASMQGWRVDMEDAHVVAMEDSDADNNTAFFGVFDGHCGAEVAKYCELNWVECVKHTPELFDTNLAQAMHQAYFLLDEQLLDPVRFDSFALSLRGKQELENRKTKRLEDRVSLQREVRARLDDGISKGSLSSNEAFELAEIMQELAAEHAEERRQTPASSGARTKAGCTAITAAIRGNQLVVANAGDSRAVLCRKGGLVVACSEDHKPNNPVEKERIVNAGGWVSEENRVNGQLALSRAIGDFDFKQCKTKPAKDQAVTCEPDVRVFDLEPGDEFLILACDGIWDVVSNEECVEFVREGLEAGDQNISELLCALLDKCLAPSAFGLGTDNMTCLVVELK
ncbi:hypothetical protein BASA81_011295 [Batrachochytrium salamandrivorans]|nr:hypothetical protein BASA81_011295 [Batrachochytrium salamandrivorans]